MKHNKSRIAQSEAQASPEATEALAKTSDVQSSDLALNHEQDGQDVLMG